MTPEEKRNVQKQIIEEIDNLKIEIEQLKKMVKPIPLDNSIGRLTRMDAINSKSVNEALLSSSRIKLNQLKTMLANIDNDDFGLCSICHNAIPIERLMLIPESDRCVKCA